MKIHTFLLAAIVSVSILGPVQSEDTIDWRSLDSRLPKPLSDFTATLVSETGVAYLAGGCDAPDGNVFNATDGQFVCGSISSSLYSFDVSTETFSSLASLPRPRYRHAAAVNSDGSKLWLVGGRDNDENLVEAVDVYDIATNTWESYGTLATFSLSDGGSFRNGDFMYVVGGYDVDYLSFASLIRLDMATSSVDNLVVQELATMETPRGDVSTVNDGTYGYASGGFTHTNDFCTALDTIERYNFAADEWEEGAVPALNTPRSDKALVVLNGKLFALGGERQIENVCQIADENLPEAGELTVAVDDVEILSEDGSEWVVVSSLPNHRFRFAAIAWDATSTIYSFGGQVSYDNSCQCFRTTDEVVAYVDEDMQGDVTSGSLLAWKSGGFTTLLLGFWIGLFVSSK
jgi:hypothetical protein